MIDYAPIRKAREQHGFTVKELAQRTDSTLATWQAYEAGTRSIKLDKLIATADLFCMSLDELIGRTPPTQQSDSVEFPLVGLDVEATVSIKIASSPEFPWLVNPYAAGGYAAIIGDSLVFFTPCSNLQDINNGDLVIIKQDNTNRIGRAFMGHEIAFWESVKKGCGSPCDLHTAQIVARSNGAIATTNAIKLEG